MIHTIQAALVDHELAQWDRFKGCSEDEISGLEQSLGVQFPEIYREFLRKMGRFAGRLFLGTDAFYPRLRNLREWAVEMIHEGSSQFELPGDAVVFLMHQGYVFFFFRVSEGDDPPVYKLVEKDQSPMETNKSYSSFLTDCVKECIDMAERRESFLREHGKAPAEHMVKRRRPGEGLAGGT